MTIKLLTAYDKYPQNAIVTLDAGTEAGLITAKIAQADTTGGVLWSEPVDRTDNDKPITLSEYDGLQAGGLALTSGQAAVMRAGIGAPSGPETWPMRVPYLMAAPPVYTNGVANAESAIAGSVLHPALLKDKFTVLGGPAERGTNFPNYLGLQLGAYPQITSGSPVAVEFRLETSDATGRFEIEFKGSGTAFRVYVADNSGGWAAISAAETRSQAADGNGYRDLVTMGAAGTYRIRIEFSGGLLFGVRTIPSDTVAKIAATRKRYIVVGDSFTEPTISDGGDHFTGLGWVQYLAHLTGYDIWSAGSGGTGYVTTNGARPKFRDRLAADVLAQDVDGVIFAGGINDISNSAGAIAEEAAACFELVRAARKELIVLSPFWPRGVEDFPAQLPEINDALKTTALDYNGKFLNLLEFGGTPEYLSGDAAWQTTVATAYAGGTLLVVADKPAYFKQALTGIDWWQVRVGSGAQQAIREVTNISGDGPYTLTLADAVPFALAVGSIVRLGGGLSYQTGTGRQGAEVGDGNSDVCTGPDTTHPTWVGHKGIGYCVAEKWAEEF